MVADETEKGWYISWIDRDPEVVARQQAEARKRKSDLDDEARRQREVSPQDITAFIDVLLARKSPWLSNLGDRPLECGKKLWF